MKKIYILLIVAASLMMSGCLKDEKFVTKTTYTGYVKNKQNAPISNLRVCIANDWGDDAVSTYTNASGHFSLTLDYKNVPAYDYYLYGTEMYLYVGTDKHPLILGQETYDYGTIIY